MNFIDDVTVEDGTIVTPGSSVDKQWLVTNSGTCNWDASYHVKWIGGDPLGAVTEQVLYPARAGSQATIRILFTAPTVVGTYPSQWQAYGPDGIAFGDPVYIEIVISP
ncbi:MAG: NBR1-Ig-like domain-containing protein [Anaerolineales bacterium]|nr:NBR1-Ig-like domain-containing protein [Anaerolineales bacterium]